MISDIIFLSALAPLFIAGIKKTEMALAALLVVEIVRPHNLTYGPLSSLPLSAIAFAWVAMSLAINLKNIRWPKPNFTLVLLLSFIIWITFTTSNALFPAPANFLWDAAFKNVLVLLLAIFCINNSRQLDLIVLITTASLLYFVYSAGIKTVLGGGGYKSMLITTAYGGGQHPLAESSTLSTMVIIYIPLAVYCLKSNFSFRIPRSIRFFLTSGIILSVPAMIGTGARTGFVCLVALLLYYTIISKNRYYILLLLAISLPVAYQFAPAEWKERMSTIGSHEEDSSALGRVVVWKWTLDFVKENPNGGGFFAYMANATELQYYIDEGTIYDIEKGKAFHNAYFQVLGEHGYFGILLYFLMLISSIYYNLRSKNRATSECLILCIAIYMIGSMFIGVAYLIWHYFFLVLSHINYQNGRSS